MRICRAADCVNNRREEKAGQWIADARESGGMNKRDLRLQQREAERRNRLLGGVLTVPSASPLLPALQQRRQQQAEFKAAYLQGLPGG